MRKCLNCGKKINQEAHAARKYCSNSCRTVDYMRRKGYVTIVADNNTLANISKTDITLKAKNDDKFQKASMFSHLKTLERIDKLQDKSNFSGWNAAIDVAGSVISTSSIKAEIQASESRIKAHISIVVNEAFKNLDSRVKAIQDILDKNRIKPIY